MKRILALLLLTSLLCGCIAVSATEDLMASVIPKPVDAAAVTASDAAAVAELALTLLRDSDLSDGNALLSPLSIMAALGMTANGAAGETLAQMEAALGLGRDRINALMAGLPRDGESTLRMANGIWLRNHDLTVSSDFLQTNANYYGAAARQAAMDDATRREINGYVKDETAGMIKDLLPAGSISDDTVMCLVNALAFEAEWSSVYERHEVREGDFTLVGGETTKVDYMYSTESRYLRDAHATGFVKYYKGREYAFAAILPNEDTTLAEYLAGIDGTHLTDMLAAAENTLVKASLPKFSDECSYTLNDALIRAGMVDAFDANKADFSAMANSPRGNISIDLVLHKTFISVAEQGTRAGAATAVMMNDAASAEMLEPLEVYLTRPFLYAIIDAETNLPIFIGVMADPS